MHDNNYWKKKLIKKKILQKHTQRESTPDFNQN